MVSTEMIAMVSVTIEMPEDAWAGMRKDSVGCAHEGIVVTSGTFTNEASCRATRRFD